jgi:hypothetical protein
MNKRLISSIAVVLIIALTVSGFLLFNEFNNFQSEINELKIEIEELEKQKSDLENQTTVMDQQKQEMINQMGDLTKQLALERHLRVEIVSFWHNDYWFAYGGLLVGYPFNASIQNNDVVPFSGLTLTVQAFYGLKDETKINGWIKIDLLQVGEERVVSGEVVVYIGAPSNLTYLATLKAGDTILDTFTLS